jgi:hypothetical protein
MDRKNERGREREKERERWKGGAVRLRGWSFQSKVLTLNKRCVFFQKRRNPQIILGF